MIGWPGRASDLRHTLAHRPFGARSGGAGGRKRDTASASGDAQAVQVERPDEPADQAQLGMTQAVTASTSPGSAA